MTKQQHTGGPRAQGEAAGGGDPHRGRTGYAGRGFSYFGAQCPSLFLRLGCWRKEEAKQYPLHSSCFEIDESILAEGTAAFCVLASEFAEKGFETDENH